MTARFPDYAWAWPTGGRHQLLQAAVLPDLDKAGAAFRLWLETHDFNDVTFVEQRLLVAISARLPEEVLSGPARARLKGIERMLWTHSTVALQAARPALQRLAEAGIPMLVFKGAARAAIDIRDLRGRFASDVDLLVHRHDFARAYQVLRAAGWDHDHAQEPILSRIIGINLRHGANGDLDLHKYPLHQLVMGDADQTALWARASQYMFLNQTVYVPSPTDRLIMAIGHGGIDGHQHSDWLVDCALLIRSDTINWALFEALCQSRALASHAAIALSYLAEALDVSAPPDVLARIAAAGRASPIALWSALVQARPKREHSAISALGRGLARGDRQVRKALTLSRIERRPA